VVDEYGRHWTLRNLSIIDGSVFPTSIGANPQLSIYAFALRAAHQLRQALKPEKSKSPKMLNMAFSGFVLLLPVFAAV
jgi:choline dehydrogenase-like flavoprotein